jgi:hypothetical protein
MELRMKNLIADDTKALSALSPHDEVMDSLVLPFVNTETMSMFLKLVASHHPDEFVVMVMDQAGWHIAEPRSTHLENAP